MFSCKSIFRTAFAAMLAASVATASAVDCRIPSQRDSTCVGISGSKPSDNAEFNPAIRGSNAKIIEMPKGFEQAPPPQAKPEGVPPPAARSSRARPGRGPGEK